MYLVIYEIRLLFFFSFFVFLIFRMSFKFFVVFILFICFIYVFFKKILLVIGGVFDIDIKFGDENFVSMILIVCMVIKYVNECFKILVNYEL